MSVSVPSRWDTVAIRLGLGPPPWAKEVSGKLARQITAIMEQMWVLGSDMAFSFPLEWASVLIRNNR
jgi:hypothetical protein